MVTITGVLSLITFLIIKKIFLELVFTSISEDLAKAEGINIGKNNFIYLASIAIIVALGVRIVGGLMTAALVAIPACTSKNVSKNVHGYIYFSLLIGATSCALGVFGSYITKLPTGPMIILFSAFFFLFSLILKK